MGGGNNLLIWNATSHSNDLVSPSRKESLWPGIGGGLTLTPSSPWHLQPMANCGWLRWSLHYGRHRRWSLPGHQGLPQCPCRESVTCTSSFRCLLAYHVPGLTRESRVWGNCKHGFIASPQPNCSTSVKVLRWENGHHCRCKKVQSCRKIL